MLVFKIFVFEVPNVIHAQIVVLYKSASKSHSIALWIMYDANIHRGKEQD